MRKLVLPMIVAATLSLASGAAAARGKKDADVTVVNRSMWAIHQLFLSSTDESEWGPDQLGPRTVIGTGEKYTINRIPCDTYDVRLVDEDGDICVVGGVPLCGDSDTWVITDEDLLNCQVQTGD
jgi:hypothetical protein